MISVRSARELLLGSVDAALDAWDIARCQGDLGPEALDLLALEGQLSRLREDERTRAALEKVAQRIEADREALAKAALDVLAPEGWLEAARALSELAAGDDEPDQSALASEGRALLRQLDDAELALWTLRKHGANVPRELEEQLQQCLAYFDEHAEAFLDAAATSRAFCSEAAPGLAERDEALFATMLKHELLVGMLESGATAYATAGGQGARLRRAPRAEILLFPSVERMVAAAAPHAPGASSIRTFRWKTATWEAVLVVRTGAKGNDLSIQFQRPSDGAFVAELEGGTVRLCGLETRLEKGCAVFPRKLVTLAWDCWAEQRPTLKVRRTDGQEESAPLVEPAV